MKKTLLSLSLMLISGFGFGQNLLSQNFDTSPPSGWTISNQSTTVGTNSWFQGSPTSSSGPFDSYAGAANSYLAVNYNSTTGANTISNWIFTPAVSIMNGDVITFYTRTTTPGSTVYPDRLQMRIGLATAAAPSGATGVGGYSTLAVDVNPNYTSTGYPSVWTQYTYTVTGLPTATSCIIAFRYFVENGGPSGLRSDYIGIDSFSVDRTLKTTDFFKNNFAVYPNPASSVINISNLNGVEITNAEITDINGRVVKQVNSSIESINISELNAGVYFLKINTLDGSGTTKIVKS